MKITALLVLLSVRECISSRKVFGSVGQNVTLLCRYNIKHGRIHFCWGRGTIPASGCSQPLISSDGYKILEGTRVSSRYQLLGRLEEGDISLTILNISEADAGQYGCRVEVPGLFNDKKHHINLVVIKAAHSSTSAPATTTGEVEGVSVSTRAVWLTSTNTPMTSSLGSLEAEENGVSTAVLLCVLFGFLVLVIAVGLIITRKWGQLSKTCQSQQVNSLAQLSVGSSSLQPRSQTTTVENIYELDVGEDGGVYEDVP